MPDIAAMVTPSSGSWSFHSTALLPPDKKENFDASLAATMNSLEDLRSNLSTDVFVSYCAENAGTGGDTTQVHPTMVVEDLKKAGFKW